jgi:hypothetical protein
MVKKIIFSVFVSFIIAFIIFLGIMQIPEKNQEIIGQSNYLEIQEKFFSKDFEINERKIFILGSSYTQALNTTQINSKIKSQCQSCQVYNLSIQGDSIDKRIKIIDSMIAVKPELIIYGISEGDFIHSKNSEFSISNSILPNLQNIIYTEINPSQYFEFVGIPPSPKDKTWNMIRQINKDESTNIRFNPFPNTPFLKILKANTVIVSELELKSLRTNIQSLGSINEPKENKTLKNLKQIIMDLQDKDIKISLFIVPHHNYVTSTESKEFKKSFVTIKEELENTTGINIHPRIESYNEMQVWHDLYHIAVNNEALIYSNDIAEIILKELDS